MKSIARLLPFALLAAILTLSSCDSLDPAGLERDTSSDSILGDPDRRSALVPICFGEGDGSFSLTHVPRRDLHLHLRRGAELPGGGRLTRDCRPDPRPAICPCFTASDLTAPYGSSTPEVHLFFDTFNWWGLDYRRTEIRSIVEADGTSVEEVAAVYITPVAEAELALMCHRAGVREGDDGVDFYYVTHEPSIREAEVCRQLIYAFAADVPCEGPACGLPYTRDQLDPDYPGYDPDQAQPRLHLDIRDRIERTSRMLAHGGGR